MCRELSVQLKGDLRFSSDWLRVWRDFSRPITGQRKAKIYKEKTQIFFQHALENYFEMRGIVWWSVERIHHIEGVCSEIALTKG